MAQRYPVLQPGTQDNCYPRMTQVDQDLAYQTFVPNEVNQVMPQSPNYQYEQVRILQQPTHPYYTLQSDQQFCLPAQQTVMYQGAQRLIPRKNRNIYPSQNSSPQSSKRFRIDGQSSPTQAYQTNAEIKLQAQRQRYYQRHAPPIQVESPCLTSIPKYPLNTLSPTNSSPSRSPILNTSVSPTSTRDHTEDVKCFHHRYQPLTPAPISQTCFRPANHCAYTLSQNIFTPLQVPAESTTSSPLLPESESEDNNNNNSRTQQTGVLETILIPDEDDTNTAEPEIVIVSVKSATVPVQDSSSSPPLIQSPQTHVEEPELLYEPYPQQGLPLQMQQQPQTPAFFPIHNTNTNAVEQNQFYTQDCEFPYLPTPIPNYIAPVQAYFTVPPPTEQYNIPVYPRPDTPNPFYACPQPVITRGPVHNPRRILRHDYSLPTYPSVSYHPGTNLREFLPFEEQGFVIHPISHPHTSSRPKKQGLTKAELKRLKLKKFKLADSKDKEDSCVTCVICMDEYKDGDKLTVLACDHDYHRDCVKDWLVKQRNCPLCRKEVHP